MTCTAALGGVAIFAAGTHSEETLVCSSKMWIGTLAFGISRTFASQSKRPLSSVLTGIG